MNTHHADSYLTAKLPADGVYYVHIGDTAHNGGEEYAYRLRISAPQPDFELRAVPSSVSLRSRSSANVTVYVIRKDGFNSPIKLALKDAPAGITSSPATLAPTQAVVGLTVRTTLATTEEPFSLVIEGRAMVDKKEIVRQAVPAEDRMQAFLWRHLVSAEKLQSLVFNPSYQPPPKRVPPTLAERKAETGDGTGATTAATGTLRDAINAEVPLEPRKPTVGAWLDTFAAALAQCSSRDEVEAALLSDETLKAGRMLRGAARQRLRELRNGALARYPEVPRQDDMHAIDIDDAQR